MKSKAQRAMEEFSKAPKPLFAWSYPIKDARIHDKKGQAVAGERKPQQIHYSPLCFLSSIALCQ